MQTEDKQPETNDPRQFTINMRGRLLDLSRPVVMGILNLTPDSFYPGSRIEDVSTAVERAGEMLHQGSTILDLGAVSSRPGSEIIPVSEELHRLMPVLEAVLDAYPHAFISIDTWRAEVAQKALAAGAHMINDISAGTMEPDILKYSAEAGAPYVAMHMAGRPGAMPKAPEYKDVCHEILQFFAQRIRVLREYGLHDIVIDPGFGFGKTVAHNFELLRKLEVFRFLQLPILVGISRKSMIWRTLGIDAGDALNGTTALHMHALNQGAAILRVHDVKAAVEVIRLWEALHT